MTLFSTQVSRGIIGTGIFCAALVGLAGVAVSADGPTTAPSYPTPSINLVAWQFDITHGQPQRIVVQHTGDVTAKAYWYITYRVTNNTDQERMFLPVFELLTNEGKLIRSDNNIPPAVYDAIKAREKNQFLEPALKVADKLLLGEDNARDSVAIWEEPLAEMGTFSIFIGGLSGEAQSVKGPGGTEVILRKALQLDYVIYGDELFPGKDKVVAKGQSWVMR